LFTYQHKSIGNNHYFEAKSMDIEAKQESLEESIFKTLSNQKRRDILRFIGERRQATFTEIKKAAEIEDSSSVSYHLTSLQTLIMQQNEKYALSALGIEAYNLIMKTNAYTSTNVVVDYLRRQIIAFIIVNAVLWVVALIAANQFEGSISQMTTSAFILLWLTGNIIMYMILRKTTNDKTRPSKLR
jgi:DNA-binding transcriptional ArsR family regulator